jgi:hypothetical protein
MVDPLSAEELRKLTGSPRPSKQVAWLKEQGFVFRIGCDGYPKVEREHYRQMMGCLTLTRRSKPNLPAS